MNSFSLNGLSNNVESFSPTDLVNNNSMTDNLGTSFLKMLTEEIKDQDPFNPINSSQMVSQLSQMSNTSNIQALKKIATQEALSVLETQNLVAVGLIGKNAGVKSNSMFVEKRKTPVSGYIKVKNEAYKDNVIKLLVTDQQHNAVKQILAVKDSMGKYNWIWDGLDFSGKKVQEGVYNITIPKGLVVQPKHIDVVQNAVVKKVIFDEKGTLVNLDNGQQVGLRDIVNISK